MHPDYLPAESLRHKVPVVKTKKKKKKKKSENISFERCTIVTVLNVGQSKELLTEEQLNKSKYIPTTQCCN